MMWQEHLSVITEGSGCKEHFSDFNRLPCGLTPTYLKATGNKRTCKGIRDNPGGSTTQSSELQYCLPPWGVCRGQNKIAFYLPVCVFVLMDLRLELMALSLQSRHRTTRVTPPVHFALVSLDMGSLYLCRLTCNHNPPHPSLPKSQDYRSEPTCKTGFWTFPKWMIGLQKATFSIWKLKTGA
jgi:hypothetical protein